MGDVHYEDTTGKQGMLCAGGMESMRAGHGVWHSAAEANDSPLRRFKPWLALPASARNVLEKTFI